MASLNPNRPAYTADPYPVLDRLRRESPILPIHKPEGWVVTGYDLCEEVLRDTSRFSSNPSDARGELGEEVRAHRASSPLGEKPPLGAAEPPDHPRMRSVVARGFTPRNLGDRAPGIRARIVELLDQAGPDQPFEVTQGLSRPLPQRVVGDLLGIPERDRPHVYELAHLLSRAHSMPGSIPPRDIARIPAAVADLGSYVADWVPPPGDGLPTLIQILKDGADGGGPLSDEELLPLIVFAITAGVGPTSGMISNLVLAFAQHPDQWQMIKRDPALIPAAVDESLRFESATHALMRYARADTKVGGRSIEAGETLLLVVAAAHHDPAKFERPDEFDIKRPLHGRDILSFGLGPHFCLGAPLVRAMAAMLLEELTSRFDSIEVPKGGLQRKPDFLLRAPASLHVRFATRSAGLYVPAGRPGVR